MSSNFTYKVLAGLLGAVSTLVVQRFVTASWKTITGDEPPNPNDPDVSTAEAVSWTVASAVGLAVAQILVNRYTTRRFARLNPSEKTKATVRGT